MANYEIVIRNRTKDDDSPIAGGTTHGKEAGKEEQGSGEVGGAWKGIMAVTHVAKSVVDQVVSHEVQIVSLKTGATEQQERLSFAYSVGKQVAGAAMSVAVGAAMGGLPGAIFGLVVSGISTMISYGQKAHEIQMKHDLEDVGLRYLNIRAGGSVASFSGSRLGRQ